MNALPIAFYEGVDFKLFLKVVLLNYITVPEERFNELITGLIDTRNYLTHGDDETKYPKRLSEPIEMHKTNEILKVILRFFIYKELDIPEDKYNEIFMQDINSIKLIK